MKTAEDYVQEIKAASDAEWKNRGYTLPAPIFSLEKGKKYIRVVKEYPQPGNVAVLGSRSVYCFVDYEGNIYKAASWKTPTKGIRGNINNNKKPLLGYEFYRY